MKAIYICMLVFFLSLTLNACGGGSNDNPPSGSPPKTGTVTLDWDIPTSKKNGDALALSEIGGYRIYASTDGNTFSKLTDVADSSNTQHVIRDLSAGTYYYSITAYNSVGDESSFSNIVKKTIP